MYNRGSHHARQVLSQLWVPAPCDGGHSQLLYYLAAMTGLFDNFAFVFLCRAVKTSRWCQVSRTRLGMLNVAHPKLKEQSSEALDYSCMVGTGS